MMNFAKKLLSVLLLCTLVFTVAMPSMSGDAYAAVKSSSQKTISGVKATTVKAKATLTSKNRVKITWTKSKGYSVDCYEVYRATSKNGTYKKIQTTKTGKATSVTNTSVTEGKKYFYKVRGVRKINGKKYYTKWSNIVSCTVKKAASGYDAIADTMKSSDGEYQVAMVCDIGKLKDGSFNEATWNGCKKYAYDNGLSYKYYRPANGDMASDDDRIAAMTSACKAGAEVVVVPGFLNATALDTVAQQYPKVQFIFIDGWDLGLKNVVAVSYEEADAGFLAGYAAVMEGFTSLGFSGGGGGYNPACIRYGYGFAQGADKAAEELGLEVEMRYSWEYGETFAASEELEVMLTDWYADGTEVIFMCGGSMFQSAAAAAAKEDGYVIGADVDQTGESSRCITSAMKSIDGSVISLLTDYFKNDDRKLSGSVVLGAKDNSVCLPTKNWKLQNWTVKDYTAFLKEVQSGAYDIKYDIYSDPADFGLEYVTFIE